MHHTKRLLFYTKQNSLIIKRCASNRRQSKKHRNLRLWEFDSDMTVLSAVDSSQTDADKVSAPYHEEPRTPLHYSTHTENEGN